MKLRTVNVSSSGKPVSLSETVGLMADERGLNVKRSAGLDGLLCGEMQATNTNFIKPFEI
jgi:hypothetical protein